MSMLDSFFSKGFKAAKCKTLLKLSIPRIKLLRNRREIQMKQMRREIAKLLETGQEATARIRVEHIIREEKMMAAQEIVELFCELITVRLPIIEAQRECPLDLKEAISSVCFAAPRCADLPELLQVQMMFGMKYGKEFVAAATELMPECGVNRQLVELLSIRAPAPDVKLKLLKEIAEEHELDWDPAASETELLKPHEDLLNGPTQFVSGSKLPLPKEKHDEPSHSATEKAPSEQSDSDAGFEILDFPEVPTASIRPTAGTVSAPEMLPFPLPPLREVNHGLEKNSGTEEHQSPEPHVASEEALEGNSGANECEFPDVPLGPVENKQFLPFISPPSLSSASFSAQRSDPPPPFISPPSFSSASFSAQRSDPPPIISRTKSDMTVDLQDVLSAAHAAADSAERAAAAARSAASLAQLRISELVKRKDDKSADNNSENPFHVSTCESPEKDKKILTHQNSIGEYDVVSNSPSPRADHEPEKQPLNIPSYDDLRVEYDSPLPSHQAHGQNEAYHQPQRLPSMDDESLFSYPNLFRSQDSNLGSGVHPFPDNAQSRNGL